MDAMQFGRTLLKRLLHKIHRANPHFGPTYLSQNRHLGWLLSTVAPSRRHNKIGRTISLSRWQTSTNWYPLDNSNGLERIAAKVLCLHRNRGGSGLRTSSRLHSGKIEPYDRHASRAWHLTDDELLYLFNNRFPQNNPLRLCSLRPQMYSSLISALSRRRSDPELLMNTPRKRIHIRNFGIHSVFHKASALSSVELRIQSPTCKSSVLDTAMGEFPPTVSLSQLVQSRRYNR